MILPVIVSAVVGTVVGTFLSRWLDKKVPPAPSPPQQVIIVDPNKVNVGDFVLVDPKEVIFRSPGLDMVTPVRYQVTALGDGLSTIIVRSADDRVSAVQEQVIPRSRVIRKTV